MLIYKYKWFLQYQIETNYISLFEREGKNSKILKCLRLFTSTYSLQYDIPVLKVLLGGGQAEGKI